MAADQLLEVLLTGQGGKVDVAWDGLLMEAILSGSASQIP